ncbi:hypothetical protein T484DRAFT_1888753 [Baffinella frigidus]|nr:hypothetical protein T484DRAFT_1888753 [Cryptophyta sp. CCMP2293]
MGMYQTGAAVLLLAALALPSSLAWTAPAITGAALRRPATTGLAMGRSRARGVQLGPRMQVGGADKPAVEMSEELLLMLAMSERKKLAVPQGGKVLVFGALDKLGQLVVRHLNNNGRYKPCVSTAKDYTEMMRYTVDGLKEYFPPETQLAFEEIPGDISAAVLCVETDTDPEQLRNFISMGLPKLQRVVLVSKIGVDSRDDWKVKMNPLSRLERWHALEQTIKEGAEQYNIDFTILRVGKLRGGPYYDCNRDYSGALEDRIFDGEKKGIRLSTGDQEGGRDTSRDVLASCVVECLPRLDAANKMLSVSYGAKSVNVECLARSDAANKVLSVSYGDPGNVECLARSDAANKVLSVSYGDPKSGAVMCSDENALGLPAANKGRERQVYTPTKSEWDEAFSAV